MTAGRKKGVTDGQGYRIVMAAIRLREQQRREWTPRSLAEELGLESANAVQYHVSRGLQKGELKIVSAEVTT